MLEITILSHFVLMTISMLIFSPLNKWITNDYKKLFVRSLPLFSLLSFFIPFFIITYICIGLNFNYIDAPKPTNLYILIVIYTIIIFFTLLKILWKELKNSNEKLKNTKILLIPSLYLFLYTSSVILSIIFIDLSNRILDFSKPEVHIVTVTGGSGRDDSFDDKIIINPGIYNIERLKVSKMSNNNIKFHAKRKKDSNSIIYDGDNYILTNEIKIKAYVYKGLYGVRYIGTHVDVVGAKW